jgi:hypothetical protein
MPLMVALEEKESRKNPVKSISYMLTKHVSRIRRTELFCGVRRL